MWERGSRNLRPSPSERVPRTIAVSCPPPQLLTFAPTPHPLVLTPEAGAPQGAAATACGASAGQCCLTAPRPPARAHLSVSRTSTLVPVANFFPPLSLFPRFSASPVLCVQCAMFGVAALCQKKPTQPHVRTLTHICAHTCSHRHTAGPQLHAKTGVWKSMKEKEEKGKGV